MMINPRQSIPANPRQSGPVNPRQSGPVNPRQSGVAAARQSAMAAATRQSAMINGRQSLISGRHSMVAAGRQSLMPPPGGRAKQVREAKQMEKAVKDRASRTGAQVPPYEFLELIGKGSFGRVFKTRQNSDKAVVAVKIIDIDKSDYQLDPAQKDQAIKDFVNEISILQTLKESQAKNINIIHEAFTFYSQLWIVSEYCPGGSVHTLMKATKDPGLEEKYIIAISRELAVALKHVHEVGIIHRDVKAANVLITQDGQLQLCDFGVSGALESNVAKRSTIIGTPYWMAPEMHDESAMPGGYGVEVDCWAYGCTVYELATGQPPNVHIAPHKLHMFLSKAPRLEGDRYSTPLRDFVAFCLEERPDRRPSAKNIMQHSFVAGTDQKYPTAILRDLIERYALWEQSGGERMSLFNPLMGAAGPETLHEPKDLDDEWNFSTTVDFDREIWNQMAEEEQAYADEMSDELVRQQSYTSLEDMTPQDRAQLEYRARRGQMQMDRLFDQNARPYEYDYSATEEESDLPLRNHFMGQGNVRESVIDLDMAMDEPEEAITIDDITTLKGGKNTPFFLEDDDELEDEPFYHHERKASDKRATMGWTFPSQLTTPAAAPAPPPTSNAEHRKTMEWKFDTAMKLDDEDSQSADEALVSAPTGAKLAAGFRPTLKHTATEPLGSFDMLHQQPTRAAELSYNTRSSLSSVIDLGDIEPELEHSRPSTGYSTSVDSSFTEDGGDPFDFEFNVDTVRKSIAPAPAPASATLLQDEQQRLSFHRQSQSEPNRKSNPEPQQVQDHTTGHARGSSFNAMESSLARAPSVKASMDALRSTDDDEEDDDESPAPSRDIHDPYDSNRANATIRRPAAPALTLETTTMKRARDAKSQFMAGIDRNELRGRYRSRDAQAQPTRRYGSLDREDRAAALPFPTTAGPSFEALDEGASAEVVIDEMKRLLSDYAQGLNLTGSLLGSVRRKNRMAMAER